jgi:2-oxoisovalerate dehydrogenase E1 component
MAEKQGLAPIPAGSPGPNGAGPGGLSSRSSGELTEGQIHTAFLIRRVEQALLRLFSEGRLYGTVHTCIGQELIGVAVAEGLRQGDWVFSNHRCHGHFIAHTDCVEGLIAEIMGKRTGVCGGWGGSQHLCEGRFFSNGIQGSIVPVAAGLALGEKLRAAGNISAAFIGEGTLGEGAVYEAANIAAKWDLPLLIVLENNHYCQSTAQAETIAGDIAQRFAALGIRCFEADCWHARQLFETAAAAAEFVRHESRPAFLRVDTYRLMAHSKGDDDRDPREVQAYWEKDLLEQFAKRHVATTQPLLAEVDARINRAVADGLAAEDAQVVRPGVADGCDSVPVRWHKATIASKDRFSQAIRDCFERQMEKDPRIVLLGEDIRSPYGGAFKVTKGLSDKFPSRVRNTPISESAIVGLGNGLALHGMRPVCEIMFGDFLTLAFDQIANGAAKFPGMYNGKVQVPLIVRTPMGGGRGYGPTHSQSLEKHFLGLPQTRVLALNDRVHPGEIYDRLFATIDRMTLVIENKLMYARRPSGETAEGFVLEHSDEPFPTVRLRPEGRADVTVVCYAGTLPMVEEAALRAFDQMEIAVEVICPVQLYPLNPYPALESVARTGRLLVVEEGLAFAAWGAELIARIVEIAPGRLEKAARRTAPAHPIPSSGPLEKAVLPNVDSILRSIAELAGHVGDDGDAGDAQRV